MCLNATSSRIYSVLLGMHETVEGDACTNRQAESSAAPELYPLECMY